MAETGGSSTTTIADPEENIDAVSAGDNAADNKEAPKARRTQMRITAERKRRSRLRNYYGELQALVPDVTNKNDKGKLVGQTIEYIQFLENTKALLEKRKQELALARQVAAEGAASSSSAPPQAAQGLAAATFSEVPVPADGCHEVPVPPLQQPLAAGVMQPLQQPLAVAAAVPAPPQLPMAPAAPGQVGFQFQTWSWPNLVLSVSNDNAYINVSVPRHLGMGNLVMVLSVLNNHGIDVLTAQVDSDAARCVLNIYARVTRMGGEIPSPEEMYKLAMADILLLLNTN